MVDLSMFRRGKQSNAPQPQPQPQQPSPAPGISGQQSWQPAQYQYQASPSYPSSQAPVPGQGAPTMMTVPQQQVPYYSPAPTTQAQSQPSYHPQSTVPSTSGPAANPPPPPPPPPPPQQQETPGYGEPTFAQPKPLHLYQRVNFNTNIATPQPPQQSQYGYSAPPPPPATQNAVPGASYTGHLAQAPPPPPPPPPPPQPQQYGTQGVVFSTPAATSPYQYQQPQHSQPQPQPQYYQVQPQTQQQYSAPQPQPAPPAPTGSVGPGGGGGSYTPQYGYTQQYQNPAPQQPGPAIHPVPAQGPPAQGPPPAAQQIQYAPPYGQAATSPPANPAPMPMPMPAPQQAYYTPPPPRPPPSQPQNMSTSMNPPPTSPASAGYSQYHTPQPQPQPQAPAYQPTSYQPVPVTPHPPPGPPSSQPQSTSTNMNPPPMSPASAGPSQYHTPQPQFQTQPQTQPQPPAYQPASYQSVPTTPHPPPASGTPADPLASLSAQMNNLHVQPEQTRAGPSDDGPISPPVLRATGPDSEVVPYCTETRAVNFSSYWYRLPDEPEYLVCTRCHEDHIKGTPLATAFERVQRPEGSTSMCGFWYPRVKDLLWPQALQTGDLSALRAFMKRRLSVLQCKGPVPSTASDGVKWYGLSNHDVPHFIACEACYEDRVAGTSFESRFSLSPAQPEGDQWACDVCIPYISRLVAERAKQNDWAGFVSAATNRMQTPQCEASKEVQTGSRNWYVPVRKIKKMHVCEACYLDKLALTRFEREFERHVPTSGVGGFLKQLGETWACSLAEDVISMTVALEAALEQRNFAVFWNAAQAMASLTPCTANGIIRGKWWTLSGGCEALSVCEACYVGILQPSGSSQFFEPARRSASDSILCSFFPTAPRFVQSIGKYAEALDKGVFSYYSDYVTKFAGVPACPGVRHCQNATWWGYPEAVFCQDCYLTFVEDTALGNSLPIRASYDERAQICQAWSPRMRTMWLETCAAGPPGSAESEAAIAKFRAFGDHRQHVYMATILKIDAIEHMKLIKMQQALHQGQLSIMYQGMDGRAALTGGGDGYMHGNSRLGWHYTENGVTAAKMRQNMSAGLADATRGDDVMQIVQLRLMWSEVE